MVASPLAAGNYEHYSGIARATFLKETNRVKVVKIVSLIIPAFSRQLFWGNQFQEHNLKGQCQKILMFFSCYKRGLGP